MNSQKMNERDVALARCMITLGKTDTEISSQFGVNRRTINDIRHGKTHKAVQPSLRKGYSGYMFLPTGEAFSMTYGKVVSSKESSNGRTMRLVNDNGVRTKLTV